MREIPFNVTFVILQHSPDKEYLYGGIMDKNTFGNPKKKEHGWFLSLNYACFFSGVFVFIFVFLLFVYLFVFPF